MTKGQMPGETRVSGHAHPRAADNQAACGKGREHIGLFVTCLVDLYRPSAAFAALHLLEKAGYSVSVPGGQTCCGQPAYNGGDAKNAREIARAVITCFEPYDYIVAPSASCAGMIRNHYPLLLAEDPDPAQAHWAARAVALAGRCFELVEFLDRQDSTAIAPAFARKVAYHDSCSALRDIVMHAAPRRLLDRVPGLMRKELETPEACCGFGGAFAFKEPEVSAKIAAEKTADIARSGADVLTGCDLGCLINLAGRLSREGQSIEVRHIAEILAGNTDTPPLGGTTGRK